MEIIKLAIMGIVILLLSTVAQAKDWYFDKDSIGGACSNSIAAGRGTITTPFCDGFQVFWNNNWNGAQAGDTIYFRAGTYHGSQFRINGAKGTLTNGTAENPIHIRAYPGEKVIFDGYNGTTYQDNLFKIYPPFSHIYVHGPFEVKNFSMGMMDFEVGGIKADLLIENVTVHNCSHGIVFRGVDGITVRNSTFYDMIGVPTSVNDQVKAIGFQGNGSTPNIYSDHVLLEGLTIRNINDGKGGDNGDGDGINTDEWVHNLTIRNVFVDKISEDGIDTKAENATIENATVKNCGASGIKVWGVSNVPQLITGRVSTFKLRNVLSAGNTETGLKCSGGFNASTTAILDNVTLWANGQNGFKNTRGGQDGEIACTETIRNSIGGIVSPAWAFGGTGAAQIDPPLGFSAYTTFDHVNLYPGGSLKAISVSACTQLTYKYSPTQYTGGDYNTDASSTVDCANSNAGIMGGGSIAPSSFDPLFVDGGDAFEWATISNSEVASNTVLLATEATYIWPPPIVGHYVEIGDDGVRRQITAIGNSTNRTITFTPALTTPSCGRATDCRGVRVLGWASATPTTRNFHLSSGSAATDAGIYVSGTHCALADDNGGSGLTDCVHWRGAAPDLGYAPFSTPNTPAPEIIKVKML